MRNICITSILVLSFFALFSQPPAQQVVIEARFLEVNENWTRELGINFQAGLNLAHVTDTPKDHRTAKPGINLGVSVEAEPWGGIIIAPGMEFFQNGQKYKSDQDTWTTTMNNIGINLTINPRIVIGDSPVSIGLVVEPSVSYAVGGTNVQKSDGEKTKEKIEFGDNDRRFQVQTRTGISTTIRTDKGDVTISGLYSFGHTSIYKEGDPYKNGVFSLNLFAKLFTRKENARNRNNLVILVKPTIIDPEEHEE